MEFTAVPVDAPGIDWLQLIRRVERSGQPLWLEADGKICGVLLPTDQARRLMGDRALYGPETVVPAQAADDGRTRGMHDARVQPTWTDERGH